MADELKVTQADEEATDVLYDLLIDSVAGRYTTISEAFARHRIATETQSQATIDELVEALRPFADCASEWQGEPNSLNVEFAAYDPPRMNPNALVDDFRQAARLVSRHKGEGE